MVIRNIIIAIIIIIIIIIINTGSMVIITTISRGYHVILVINVISNRYTPSKRCISICVNISVFLQEEKERATEFVYLYLRAFFCISQRRVGEGAGEI